MTAAGGGLWTQAFSAATDAVINCVLYLRAFGNRLRVWTVAMWSYFTRQRSSQLIVEPRRQPDAAPNKSRLSEEPGKVYESVTASN